MKYFRNGTQFTATIIVDDGNVVGAGLEVTFNINGVFYTRQTEANGIVTLSINLNPGDYIITAMYGGCRVSNNVTVLPTLSAKDISMTYRDGTRFECSLVDGQGRPYANQEITYNVNGVFYTRTTDASGVAGLNINLMPGEYIITSMYGAARISNRITIRA